MGNAPKKIHKWDLVLAITWCFDWLHAMILSGMLVRWSYDSNDKCFSIILITLTCLIQATSPTVTWSGPAKLVTLRRGDCTLLIPYLTLWLLTCWAIDSNINYMFNMFSIWSMNIWQAYNSTIALVRNRSY